MLVFEIVFCLYQSLSSALGWVSGLICFVFGLSLGLCLAVREHVPLPLVSFSILFSPRYLGLAPF